MIGNMIKHCKSCQDLAVLHGKKTSRYIRTCMIFAWLSRNKILTSCAKKISRHVLIRFCQDLTKVIQEIFAYQDLGKMFHILQELSRSCLTWQGVCSFFSLGIFCEPDAQVKPKISTSFEKKARKKTNQMPVTTSWFALLRNEVEIF